MLESSVNSLRELYVRPGPMSKYLTGTINSQNLAEAWEPMQRGLSGEPSGSHFCQNFNTGPYSTFGDQCSMAWDTNMHIITLTYLMNT